MEGQVSFNIKVVDNNNCTSISNIILGPQPTNPFIILVSVSGSSQFTVPTNPLYPYNYTVKTSEQTFNNVTGDTLLTWSNPGDYTVEITEQFPTYLYSGGSELQEVQQWGDIVWYSFENSFSNSNVDVTATDVPNLTFVTNFNNAFSDCNNLENLNGSIGLWDVSNVTNMSNMFDGSNFNQPLSGWNVSNLTNMSSMFKDSPFDQYINNWDVSSVTNMNYMFGGSYFNQPLSGWNVSNVTDMGGMFQDSLFSQDINNWDVSNVTDMSNMFNTPYLYPIIVFNQNIGNWNISNVTNFTNFMSGKTSSTFSTTNLDSIYNGWSTKNPKTGITINFGTANYTISGGSAGRAILTGSTMSGGYGWTIIDGGGI
jgi:surface protein